MERIAFSLVVTALLFGGCVGSREKSSGSGADLGGETFVERWTEDADRRRAEGQYMGYYSKPAYIRSEQRRSVKSGAGR